jgi:hypothetical protein
MDANIHAVAFLAVFPLIAAFLWKFGRMPRSRGDWKASVLSGIGGFLATGFLPFWLAYGKLCGPDVGFQVIVPVLSSGVCVAAVRGWKLRTAVSITYFVIAVVLNGQFWQLTMHDGRYVGLENGKPFILCSKPVIAHGLWHSWFTGIYGLEIPKESPDK